MGVLEVALLLPCLLGGGLGGGEEERGALHSHVTPLRLVDGGVRPPRAGLDDIIHVVGPQDRHITVVLQDPMEQVAEGAGLLVGGEEGAGDADAGNGGARRVATLVSGWAARPVQPNPSGPA